VIVAVCADKGSPGVTTLALALALVWPGERLLLEADPAGADLAFRLRRPGGGLGVDPEPSVLSLAVDARAGLAPGSLPGFAQQTAYGVPLIPGPATREDHHPMGELWAGVAAEAAVWDGVVVADLGRCHPGHPAMPLVQAANVVLVLARPTVEGLYRLRHRVIQLERLRGGQHDPTHDDSAGVAVAVLASRGQRRDGIEQATRLLRAAGSAAVVAGAVSFDPAGVAALYAARKRRRLTRSALVASAAVLAETLVSRWPGLATARPSRQQVVS
jgi:hypothetical protein